MTAIWTWFRFDLRSRWRSLLVLALLVAFSAGTVMTAVAGARRGESAVDRLAARTLPATAAAVPNQPGFDWDAVRALPEVEALTGFALAGYGIDGVPPEAYAGAFAPADAEVFDTIERPVMLEGRVLDPTRVDEVMVSPSFLSEYGYEVGDRVTLRLLSPEQVDAELFGDVGEPMGPAVEATIVGVPRTLWYSEKPGEGGGALVPSPALFATYPDSFLGAAGTGFVNALVRLRNGADDVPRFKTDLEALTGRSDIDVWNLSEDVNHYREVTGFEAGSLLVFAVSAAIAALFIVGQAVGRHVTSTLTDLEPLRAVGMTPAETNVAVIAGPTLAAVSGWVLGAGGAAVASRWFPIGTAAPFEPSPGLNVDLAVFAAGLLLTVLLVTGGGLVMSLLALRSRTIDLPPRRSAVATAATRAGLSVPAVVGARFALEPGRGRTAIPVRPALLGATIGVLGVLAALTLSGGINDAVHNPERFGFTYELGGFIGFNGFDFAPTDDLLPAVDQDPDVVAVDDARMDVAQVDDVAVSLFSYDPVDAPLELVLLDGHPPRSSAEVTLGPRSADAAGLHVGDTATFAGTRGPRVLTVSGIGFVPSGPHNDYATGGWVTADGYDSLFDGFKFHFVLIDVSDDADVQAVVDRLGAFGLDVEAPEPPSEATELQQVRAVPLFLAGFLLVLALGAVGHALATAVRRRSHDVAVLRAVGMGRGQSRMIVTTQATILALVGLAAGIPLGLALGRTVWRFVAERTPLFYLPPSWSALLLTVIPIALIAANLLAVGPSRRAARLRLAQALRAE